MKGFIFDYGGTIDTNGIHWAEVLCRAYIAAGLMIDADLFRNAYVHGERTLALHPIIQPGYTFRQVLEAKVAIQIQYIADQQKLSSSEMKQFYGETIVAWCDNFVRATIVHTGKILDSLSKLYPLVVVSNFYGNLHSVLEDYEINHYFQDVVESAVVGVRKPDSAIFQLGVERLGLYPEEVVVIGDSLTKDITPSKMIGCHTIWLKGPGWDKAGEAQNADEIIYDLREIATVNIW